MKQFIDSYKNYAIRFNNKTVDHFMQEIVGGTVPEYLNCQYRAYNTVLTYGLKLAKRLKYIMTKIFKDKDILVTSIEGVYDLQKQNKLADMFTHIALSVKFGAIYSIWCNPAGKLVNKNAPLQNINPVGFPITDTFLQKAYKAVLTYYLPLISSYIVSYRTLSVRRKSTDNPIISVQHGYLRFKDFCFTLLYLILSSERSSYLSRISALYLMEPIDERYLAVTWAPDSTPQEVIHLYFGYRLKGALYKPYKYFEFSGRYFCDLFKEKREKFLQDLHTELYQD
jgi:hypothetical protein